MKLVKISPYVYPGIKDTREYVKIRKFDRDRISKEEILSIVSQHCSVSKTKILTRIREREVIDARHMYIAVMRLIFRHPVTEIGKMVDRDHTTILDALKKFSSRYDNYDDYKEVADSIFNEIKTKIA
jgi:chromosomal replication initiator protein